MNGKIITCLGQTPQITSVKNPSPVFQGKGLSQLTSNSLTRCGSRGQFSQSPIRSITAVPNSEVESFVAPSIKR